MAMNMRGSLNVSQYQKSASQPRFYGKALIHGVKYKIKGWEKESAHGPWISLLFEDPVHGSQESEAPAEKPSIFSQPVPSQRADAPAAFDNAPGVDDDDVPF